MPEYRFDVLCVNNNTCDVVMAGMKQDYDDNVEKISDPKDRDYSDHFVKLACKNIDDTDQVSREMIQRYSNHIRTITVKPL